MIVVLERDKAEGLKDASCAAPQRIQHFSHTVDLARVSLKSHLDEIALRDWGRQLQQSSGGGDDLQPAFGFVTVA